MNIGEKIKELRKKNDLTQEKLADYLRVSYQAVSKWETGVASPDLSLIVPLTKLFQVTADELLGLNEVKPDQRRIELETAYRETWTTGDLDEMYSIADTAVFEYPGDMKYLDWLAWTEAMRSFNFKDDETYIAEQEKAIKHFICVIENCADEKIRASSIQGVVQYLSIRGRHDEAKKYALLYPDNLSMSKDDVVNTCLQGKEKLIHSQKMLEHALTDILNLIGNGSMIACLAQEQIITALISDGNYMYYHCFLADSNLSKAMLYVKENDIDNAIKALVIAHEHAVKYDEFITNNRTYHFTSPFFDEVEYDTANICRTGTTTQEQDFYEALSRESFDAIRDEERFKALLDLI